MCDCIKRLNGELLIYVEKDKESVGIVNKGQLQHMGLSLTGKSGWRTYQEFEYEMTNKKKDGSMGATRNYKLSIYHTFCPFCGEKYQKEDE